MKRKPQSSSPLNYISLALMGGIFILGIGIGIAFSSTANLSPQNFASREFLDRSAPNPEVCAQYGASAMVVNSQVYLTLNPFNVYVAQPSMEPGCVLRTNNWNVLERQKAITSQEVRECKNRMNTFGFTGRLEEDPHVQCIYQNTAEDNGFLQPGMGDLPPETERF
ncbi:DUF3172 domain-containing protein [Oscillatoriales cyanobacterium LEGE 11467]|uniref:DUF3172 domain-containing protein n=1 Tax=Zarconia navalis LEGE 11467 TaxID=1828826 RepID=A0A928W1U5_9CYAN|nr:DUF3172 domain-containing protein [Zarconia navalis]MBE9042436.1 DUF3172 domain-containing protein [Zarconia navalis LEGE 11467]